MGWINRIEQEENRGNKIIVFVVPENIAAEAVEAMENVLQEKFGIRKV